MRDGSPGLDKYLLGQVIGERDVTTASTHQVAYPGLSLAHEFCARVAIAIARQPDKNYFRALSVKVTVVRQGYGAMDLLIAEFSSSR